MNKNQFGQCDFCGGKLYPIYFTEEETAVKDGHMFKTGRNRCAVSHLVCKNCLKNFTVDDSFDEPWAR